MTIQQQVIDKLNQGQEIDAHKYSWNSIPLSLRKFWCRYFLEQKKNDKFANN